MKDLESCRWPIQFNCKSMGKACSKYKCEQISREMLYSHSKSPGVRILLKSQCTLGCYIGKCLSPFFQSTGWPKSNVPKVRAYCSASDHLIRKIFAGVCRDIHWFEEYLKIIEIDDHFFE